MRRFAPWLLILTCCSAPKYTQDSGDTGTSGGTGVYGNVIGSTNPPASQGGAVIAPSGASGANGATGTAPTTLFSRTITEVDLEVDYQDGAPPYTGAVGSLSDVWQIFRDNANALFINQGKTLRSPNTIGQMEKLTDITLQDFTVSDLLDIAFTHRQMMGSATSASFYVVMLNGYFADSTGRQAQVLGVSLGNTAIIALFKPVIAGTATLLRPNTAKFVEQATLVHEFGHAVGLVDNGLTMQVAHLDTAHGKHCSNSKCGMYWENEGASSSATFFSDYFDTGSTILFDTDCLNDAHAAAAAN